MSREGGESGAAPFPFKYIYAFIGEKHAEGLHVALEALESSNEIESHPVS